MYNFQPLTVLLILLLVVIILIAYWMQQKAKNMTNTARKGRKNFDDQSFKKSAGKDG